MITVRKANRIIRVSENELAKYTSKGYVEVNPPQPQVEVEAKAEVAEEEPKNTIVIQSEAQAVAEPTPVKRSKKRR